MHNYQELKVWQKATDLAIVIYKLTSTYAQSEQFNLTLQMRKSVVSVPSNIAEGAGRNTNKDFDRFLSIALGSIFELQTQLIISLRLDYLNQQSYEDINEKIEEIKKMIWGLSKKLGLNLSSLSS